ncbi:MAG: hypothetical protein IV094_15965 [Vitreoscilla sp.]|nr:hypothetical protein [Vitreoscilla sp.]
MVDSNSEFEREHGSTESDWLRCLPGAVGPHRLTLGPPGEARVTIGDGGQLHLRWQVLPERRIALMRMPRMQVHYRFAGSLSDEERAHFLRYFDLFLQRGGG